MAEQIQYIDRAGSGCNKWDHQTAMFGEEGLLPLWIADMDFRAAECIRQAVHAYVDFGVFGYNSPTDGYYQAFIDWEKRRHGYEVQRGWLRFSPGVVPAFNWLIQALSQPGDRVIVLTPVYYPFLHAVENNDRVLVTSELKNDHGYYTVDFDDFERKIQTQGVKLFILCSPHNPVGRVWSRDELRRMMDICRKHHVCVISDEIHHDLTFEGHPHIPTALTGDYDDILITLTAPSKTFNLAGLQNSLVILPDPALRAKYDQFTKRIRIHGGNAVGYVAAEAAYRGGEEWLEQVKAIILGNYRYARDALAGALPHLVISPLEGTYLMWIDFGAYLAPEEMEGFFQGKCRLAVDYGTLFGGNAPCCIRLNLATSRENVAEAVRRITGEMERRRPAGV